MLGNFSCFYFRLLTFSKINLINFFFQESNVSDPDKVRCYDGPDLDPNCLQRLSEDDVEI